MLAHKTHKTEAQDRDDGYGKGEVRRASAVGTHDRYQAGLFVILYVDDCCWFRR